MKARWKENPVLLQFLLGVLLFLILTTITYLVGLFQPSLSGLALFARSNSTRTAIALTSQALMGPFPTATGPTPTPSWTPSMTPTPTTTPSNTPTPTRVRYFINTGTPRTLVPGNSLTSTAAAPATRTPARSTSTSAPPARATNTGVQPTNPPPQATNPPPQATDQPKKSTKTAKPPKPTKPPKSTKTPKKEPLMGACLSMEGCYEFPMDHAARLAYEYPERQRFTRNYRD